MVATGSKNFERTVVKKKPLKRKSSNSGFDTNPVQSQIRNRKSKMEVVHPVRVELTTF